MEAMVYIAHEDATPEFRTVLWRDMQNFGTEPMSRKEMAARLTRSGFKASESNVTQWLNGDRTPPPGLPYYATIALELEAEQGQLLAWAYSRTYRDNRKGAKRSGINEVTEVKPLDAPHLTEVNELKIAEKHAEYETRDREKRQGQQKPGDTDDTGDRAV